jgi:prepilin-type N-terminal cleavage/methylation domain-containing protein
VRAAVARSKQHEDGFTLIEVLIAMVITLIVMTALLGAIVSALKTVAQARERQAATGLATEALEQIRALPYDTVTNGTTGAPNDTYVASGMLQTGLIVSGASNETVLVNSVSPKITATVVSQITYTVRTYVTRPASGSSFNLTAVTSWTSNAFPNGKTVAERSTTFSPPSGCLSTATHPFAAPCQAYLRADAGTSPDGYVAVGPLTGATLEGFSGTGLDIALPTFRADMTIEQIVKGHAQAVTTNAGQAGSATRTGGGRVEVSVDSDPSSVAFQTIPTTTTSAHVAGAVSVSGAAGTLTARPSSSESGSASSAVASTTCTGSTGTLLATGPAGSPRPCANAAITQGPGAGLVYTTPAGTQATVLSIGAGALSRAVGAQLATPNAGLCSGTSTGAGCALAAATRTSGAVVVGSPTGSTGAPAVFAGVVQVSSSTDSVRAEEGVGSTAPAWTRTGTARVWNGTGYTDIPLNNPPALPTPNGWIIAPVSLTYGTYVVTYQGEVVVRKPVTTRSTRSATTPCVNESCESVIDGSSSVVMALRVTITSGATQIGSFVTTMNLGGLSADASFRTVS